MAPKRLRRLKDFPYTGANRYSLTISAHDCKPLFENEPLADCVVTHILRSAAHCGYEVIAYCVMPNHVHVLAHAAEISDPLAAFVKRAKQLSGFHGKRIIGAPVWQAGYYERVLRDSEDTRTVAAYILNNPVRRGIVDDPRDYPWSGSGVGGIQELVDFVQIVPARPT